MTRRIFRFCLLAFLPLGWAGGLLWFYLNPLDQALPSATADAIIVLTGGRDRIKYGIDLYRRGKGKLLLITGVHKDVRLQDLFPKRTFPDQERLKEVAFLDYEASNTIENAQRARDWILNRDVQSVILVTADFHMRRSLLEFHQRLDNVKIYSYPVPDAIYERSSVEEEETSKSTQDRKFFLVLKEYHKYIGALGRSLIRAALLFWRSS